MSSSEDVQELSPCGAALSLDAHFEGKPPEFFQDWRFLLVGARWWWAKINGKA